MAALAEHSLVLGSLETKGGPLMVSDSLRPFSSFDLVAEKPHHFLSQGTTGSIRSSPT